MEKFFRKCIYTYTPYGLFTNVVPTTNTSIIIVITPAVNQPTTPMSTIQLARLVSRVFDLDHLYIFDFP